MERSFSMRRASMDARVKPGHMTIEKAAAITAASCHPRGAPSLVTTGLDPVVYAEDRRTRRKVNA
jgi:hypothetical protein